MTTENASDNFNTDLFIQQYNQKYGDPSLDCRYIHVSNDIRINKDFAVALKSSDAAAVLDKIIKWVKSNEKRNKHQTHFHKGRWWTYNSIPNWIKKHFPWISDSKMKRILSRLVNLKIIIIDNFNHDPRNRTNWYSINYLELNIFMHHARGQNDPMADINNLGHFTNNSVTNQTENTPLAQEVPPMGQNDLMEQVKMTSCIYTTNNLQLINNSLSGEILTFEEVIKWFKSEYENSDLEIDTFIAKAKVFHGERMTPQDLKIWLFKEWRKKKRSNSPKEIIPNLRQNIALESIDHPFERQVRLRLEEILGTDFYENWIQKLYVADMFFKYWHFKTKLGMIKDHLIRNHYDEVILQVIQEVCPDVERIEIEVV